MNLESALLFVLVVGVGCFLVFLSVRVVTPNRRLGHGSVKNPSPVLGIVPHSAAEMHKFGPKFYTKRDPANKRPYVRSGRGSHAHRPKKFLRNGIKPSLRANWRRYQMLGRI